MNGLFIGTSYSLVGVGFTLIFGVVKVLNFAYGEFFMVASYVTYFLYAIREVSLPVVLLLNFALMLAAGCLVDRGLIRPLRARAEAGSSVIIATLGLQVILQSAALLIWGGTYRGIVGYMTGSVRLGGLVVSKERLAVFAVSVCLLLVLEIIVRRTKLGMAMRAVAENDVGAALAGINVGFTYAISFGISAGLAGVAGTLLVPLYNVYPTVGARPMMKAFAVTLLGGMGHIEGALVAGIILGVAEALASAYVSALVKDAVAFVIMIAVLVLYPGGIGEALKKLRMAEKAGMAR